MKNTEQVVVTMDLGTAKMLEDYAEGRKMSISMYVALALRRMFEFDDEVRSHVSSVEKIQRRARVGINIEDGWKDTDNEAALLLRRAHYAKVNFSRISEMSGVGRRKLYFYINDERICPEAERRAIKAAVETLMAEKAASEN